MDILELATRVETYDPKLSPDNRADELALHQDVVMLTGEGSLTCDFDRTFVRSLDAAMTLVPEGHIWMLTNSSIEGPLARLDRATALVGEPEDTTLSHIEAATPALALTAACLRARAAELSK